MMKKFTKIIRYCDECPNISFATRQKYYYCGVTRRDLGYGENITIPKNCPLKDLPKEEEFLEKL